jgi:hypothetical protein
MKLNLAVSIVGEAEADSESLGNGDAGLADGDCDVDGF